MVAEGGTSGRDIGWIFGSVNRLLRRRDKFLRNNIVD